MPTLDSKRKRKNQEGAAAVRAGARLTRVRPTRKKKEKAASSEAPGEATAMKQPVSYLVVEHGVDDPTHSVLKVAGAGAHPLLYGKRGMSFAAVGTRHGPRIVGVGPDTLIYDPKTSTEVLGPRLFRDMLHPVLIPHGSKLYALSRCPAVVGSVDFMPWFFSFDLNDYRDYRAGWLDLPPPPIFPCRINPLEYRNPPEVRVASYAMVGSHILLSVQKDKQDKGTCAFDVDTKSWEIVDDKNLPFTGQAVPLDGHRFVACSKARDGAAAVYYMRVFRPEATSTGKMEMYITELPVESKGIIVPGQFLCTMGTGGRFSSFDVRSIDPGTGEKLDKARIIYRSYSLVGGGDNARTKSVVVVKQQRKIYKLRDPYYHLAYPLPVVAGLTM
ncbi:hypothetical protein U9M48_021164 [Paspalum notatum var. saurae]|uniref:Uncharacterized protein n=1 Tax=Paspalum notatum var. saurae TaxID=547442 RepID=A0AAQ3TGS5_PASNO